MKIILSEIEIQRIVQDYFNNRVSEDLKIIEFFCEVQDDEHDRIEKLEFIVEFQKPK